MAQQTRMVLDEAIVTTSYGPALISHLNEKKIHYKVRKLTASHTILWERKAFQDIRDYSETEWKIENHVYCLICVKDLNRNASYTLRKLCREVNAAYPNKRLTLTIITDKTLQTENYNAKCLNAVQICYAVQWRWYSTFELAEELQRINKAMMEKIYKQQRTEAQLAFKSYLQDKKRCVRITGSLGLKRLWQQSLSIFQGVTLHVSEALILKYPCPKSLLYICKNKSLSHSLCSTETKSKQNNELAIKGAINVKLYKYYCSIDPSDVL